MCIRDRIQSPCIDQSVHTLIGGLNLEFVKFAVPVFFKVGIGTVSYTHLDVYKRQWVYCFYMTVIYFFIYSIAFFYRKRYA